jgi:hypothetical protein
MGSIDLSTLQFHIPVLILKWSEKPDRKLTIYSQQASFTACFFPS